MGPPPWNSFQHGSAKMSTKRRSAWEENLGRKNRFWEQKLHSLYGLEAPLPERGGSLGSSAREQWQRLKESRPGAPSVSQSVCSSRAGCTSRLGTSSCAMRSRSTECPSPMGAFRSLRDESSVREDVAFMSVLRGDVDELSKELSFMADSQDDLMDSQMSGSLSARLRDSRQWHMPPLEPLSPKAPMPCKRVKPSCWFPGSRDNGGRYSNSPGPPTPGDKDELESYPSVTLMSCDGKAMRMDTPYPDFLNSSPTRKLWSFRPWLHCAVRP